MRLRLDENKPDAIKAPTAFYNSAPGADPKPLKTTGTTPIWGEETNLWPTFRLAPNTLTNLGQVGDFETNHAFSAGGWIKTSVNKPTIVDGALLAKMDAVTALGWNLASRRGRLMAQIVSVWPSDAIGVSVDAGAVIPQGKWTHVWFNYDGSGKAAGLQIYVNGRVQPVVVMIDTLKGSVHTEVPATLGSRYPNGYTLPESSYQDMRIYDRALTAEEVQRLMYEDVAAEILKAKKPATWSSDERQIVANFFFSQADPTSTDLQAQIAQLDQKLAVLSSGGAITLISREADTLPYADILSRGGFNSRIGRVAPDTPHFLPPMAKDAPHNRLGLAEWVISPENPLTARVTVNRMWQELFGIGLVETSEDYGIVGERPSNQALLDYLAADFRENGWQVKRMYQQMVMSAAYRQSAKAAPEAYADDSKNQLLARGPRFRMDAEMLRDTALQTAGLLVEKSGGPSVRPYQPAGVWEAGGQPVNVSDTTHYIQDHGENLYRRSMYTFLKRQAMMPNMEALDAPDRQIACMRRQLTNTPLAALVLFNDVQLLEAARLLGQRAIDSGGANDVDKLHFIAQTVLTTDLAPTDQEILLQSLADFRKHYEADPAAAAELLKQGEAPKAPAPAVAEQAAWMMVAHQFLNFDAYLNK